MTGPSAPSSLSPAAAAVWDEIVAEHPEGRAPVGPEFEAYCVQVARMRDARARIDKEGLIVADEKGRPVAHPAAAIEKAAGAEVRAWGDKFRARRRRD